MAVRQVPEKNWTKDGRKWMFEIRVKDNNGKKHHYRSKMFLTKKEAQKAEREYINDIEKNNIKESITLGELMNEHFEYQKDKVKYTTQHNYKKKLSHFKSLIDIKISDLNINDIEKWKEEINNKLTPAGTPLATRTKNDLFKYLKSILNYGTKWHDFNFASMYNKMTNFNNPNELPKEMEFYTYEEFKKFISVEDDIRFKTLFETLYYCGLRRGEIRGLTWNNIDFDRKELSIKQNVVNVSGDSGYWLITTPKTKTSMRIIPMPNNLVSDMKLLKEESKKIYGFEEKWFVFGDIAPIHPDVLRRRKNENAKKAGVKQIRIHDFRHSCASLLINNGANITMVAKYLGHSKIDETLNTYSHMFKNKLDNIVDTINRLDS